MPQDTILVVDRDTATVELVQELTKSRGYETIQSRTGTEAIRLAAEVNPLLYLLDRHIPEISAASVIRTLRSHKEFSMTPAVFFAESREVRKRLGSYMLGADRFLPKPFTVPDLEKTILDALEVRTESASFERGGGWTMDELQFTQAVEGMRGSLDQIGMASLLSFLEMDQKSGELVLILRPKSLKVRLYLKEGRVHQARLDDRPKPVNAELIYALLGKAKGRFDFRPGSVKMADEIKMATTALLMEGARRLDESKS